MAFVSVFIAFLFTSHMLEEQLEKHPVASFIARIISIVPNHKGPYVLPKCRQDNLIDVICPQPLASHNSLSETIHIFEKYITKTIYTGALLYEQHRAGPKIDHTRGFLTIELTRGLL